MGEAFEDIVGAFDTGERPGIFVPGLDPGADVFTLGLGELVGARSGQSAVMTFGSS
jgi:hypothetical protein